MLLELRVENLLLIERAELRLAPGLNVITGETGAGKTMLAHALDLLLGGKPRAGTVRPGALEAWVEGIFELPDGLRSALGDRIAPDADDLVLARRVGADGRTRAYLGGRSATVGDLREAGEALLAFYGQHEHRRLTLASAQLEVLDAFCGAEQHDRRAAYADAWVEVRGLRARRAELAELAGARERELDLLRFELSEIEAAEPSEAERDELGTERERLRHQEALRAGALAAVEALSPESGGPGATFLLAEAGRRLEEVAGVDGALDALGERFASLRYEAEDLAGELRRYEETVEAAPGRLEEVEDRLAELARLERKHGGTTAAVLAHAERCRARRDELEGAEVALGEVEAGLAAAEGRMDALAAALRKARAGAAGDLARAVRARLGELAMEGAQFEVEVTPREEPGATGADQVEFLISTNPGVAAGPLREIASGGETSRVMLALMSVAHSDGASGGDGRLLVFDEVDAGIGGVTARTVGAQLRALAEGRQILCITHLPQIASLGARHFVIAKDTATEPARTTVTGLDGDGVVGELVRMLGAAEGDRAARAHAKELLKAA
jgi:DNA repair protein RecN (Recombination protein N)